MAEKNRGTRHSDLYLGFLTMMRQLGSNEGCRDLGLHALGSFLWSESSIHDFKDVHISNDHLLDSIRALCFVVHGRIRMPVDYRNLGSEELGSVYESLLELHPEINTESGSFQLVTSSGHERRTTGSYYTPPGLVQSLLDTSIDPILSEAMKKEDPEIAILNLKICDPATGSGHFLIAAAHRMAKRLASIRTSEEEPPPASIREALRDVISHCIYGVDINPLAVELCKIGLWIETLEPGKPLSFLENRIRCGNSLIGTTPELLNKGIPDEAFTVTLVPGDWAQ